VVTVVTVSGYDVVCFFFLTEFVLNLLPTHREAATETGGWVRFLGPLDYIITRASPEFRDLGPEFKPATRAALLGSVWVPVVSELKDLSC
jgi:hypothetical protein